jgi:5-deoxy-D-glucuronate isomerase
MSKIEACNPRVVEEADTQQVSVGAMLRVAEGLHRSLDETLAFQGGDVMLVPEGYHVVSAPPGYDLYYLNVMAGPT